MSKISLVKAVLISGAFAVASLGLSACNNGGDSGPSGDVINVDIDEVDLTESVADNQQQASGLKVEPSQVVNDSSQTVKITNTSSQAIPNLNVKLAGSNLKGVTVSGCQGRLAGGSSCKLKVKANSQASGSGKIIVSASGVDDKDIPVAVKSAYLESSGNTLTKPSSGLADVRWITIKNNSEVTAQFKEANVTLSDSQGDNITIKKDLNSVSQKQPHSNCFDQSKPYNDKGTITLAPQSKDNSQCEIPIVAEAEAKSHVFINISGNFFHRQHIPVNFAPGRVTYDKNTMFLPDDKSDKNIELTWSGKFSTDIQLRDALGNEIEQFQLSQDDSKTVSLNQNDFNSIPYRPSTRLLVNAANQTPLDDNLAVHKELSQGNDPVIYPVPRQNDESAGVDEIGVVVKSRDGTDINIKDIRPPEGSDKADLEIRDPNNCISDPIKSTDKTTKIASGHTCKFFVKANVSDERVGSYKKVLDVVLQVYNSNNGSLEGTFIKRIDFNLEHRLIATGGFQTNSKSTGDVDNSAIMSWNGSQWRWSQGGDTVFSEIDHAVVDDKGRVCVNGVTGFDTKGGKQYDFDCFNGYRWAGIANPEDSDGMAVKRFAILRAGKAYHQDADEIINILAAVPVNHNTEVSLFNDNEWSGPFNLNKQIGNLIMSPAFGSQGDVIGFITQHDTVNKAKVFTVSSNEGSELQTSEIGNTISNLHRPKIGDEEKPYRLVSYAFDSNSNGSKSTPAILIGGQTHNNHPVVYRNKQDNTGDWQERWENLGGPVLSMYDDPDNEGLLYVGTTQLDLDTNTLVNKPYNSGAVLADESGEASWQSLIDSNASKITNLVSVSRITGFEYLN